MMFPCHYCINVVVCLVSVRYVSIDQRLYSTVKMNKEERNDYIVQLFHMGIVLLCSYLPTDWAEDEVLREDYLRKDRGVVGL
jgi:hypothetical protein